MHAHRRDNAALDAPPGLGCSSKLAAGPLIVHNRLALEDRRPWVSTSPQIVYGTIYQWWQRDPRAHPTLPGNAAIAYPVPGHYPDDRVFSNGYGTYPPGHPGNTIGLPAPAGNNNAPGSTTAKRPGSSGSTASTASKTNSSGHSRTSSGTSVSSGASKAAAAPTRPWVFIAASGKAYPNIPLVAPYARIPAPSAAAVTYANNFANAVNKASPAVVKAFNQAWAAFIAAWGEISRSQFCDDASLCTQTSEFKTLVALASAKGVKPRDIVALIVSKLATEPKSFVGVFAYNALEKDGAFLVYRKDLFNYNVLQRHANLIVEMNSGRK
ncbi:hypothetical protein N658DRAFT_88503 [Parathielavia hyrcaniae]|uniref:Uncharacterized protein n=1 Tax=Parathielavia hyrcaniae TaxID=113614 RepID=A0AAN6T1L4_9PEZI|nr:hypothetical protein N658DRAFT_88503 [Parathielavia hyrcaniae]